MLKILQVLVCLVIVWATPALALKHGTQVVAAIEVAGPSLALFNSPPYTCSSNLYVSTTGSDTTGTGTSGNPWATLQKANDSVPAAGTCINVAAGLYTVVGTNTSIVLNNGGNTSSPTGYVVYRSTIMNGAHLKQGASNVNGPLVSFQNTGGVGGSYIMFDGFEVDGNANLTGKGCLNSIVESSVGSAHHLWFLNNTVHDCGLGGIVLDNKEYYWILHNLTYNNSSLDTNMGSGISVFQAQPLASYTPTTMDLQWTPYHIIINYNVSHDNFNPQTGGATTDGNGIIFDDWDSVSYGKPAIGLGNVAYHNGGKGVHAFGSSNVTVANNTAYNNNWDTHNTSGAGFRAEIDSQAAQGNTFVNNIAYAVPGTGGGGAGLADIAPYYDQNGTGVNTWTNNIAWGLGNTTWPSTRFTSPNASAFSCVANLCNSNPLFVSVAGPTFVRSTAGTTGTPVTTFNLPPFSVAVGSGDTVIGGCFFSQPGAITYSGVTDDKGNIYNLSTQLTNNGFTTVVFWRGNITNAPTTLTINFSGTTGPGIQCKADDYSNVALLADPSDGRAQQVQTSPGTTANAVTSGAFNTTADGDLIWTMSIQTGLVVEATAGTGFTSRGDGGTGFTPTADKILSLYGSTAGTWTIGTNGAMTTFAVAIKALNNFALQGSSPAIAYGTTGTYFPPPPVDAGACNHMLTTCP